MMSSIEILKSWLNPVEVKNSKILNIKQRMSLREPQKQALDIVADLVDDLELSKEVDLASELAKVKAKYQSCSDFERDFVSLCFSIATGVGKTRLMGAIITYLYQHRNIRNFFVLAPNLTIYNKLIEDFGNPAHPKYVFRGIADFASNRPVIITGDNYNNNKSGLDLNPNEIRINVFNISKFNNDANSPTKGKEKGAIPKIRRLSEYLGQSYWEYLTNLDDLVILMDEAHRYHADKSKTAINELKPVLGIELTATPIDEKGKQFKNVVYEYSLARALDDGKYIKNPAVATRQNFDAKSVTSDEDLDKIKLEDAISIHEQTKVELELYARNSGKKLVKPFILVVCKDTTHAKTTYDYINSSLFYQGRYSGKVLQIDSTTNDDEQNMQFLTLENSDNIIEIVIHVYKLKEGWDVTNLYTIVPLNAAHAVRLIEQTIGRGLRLPYGERTGINAVDKLTVLAHENFENVIKAAQDGDSILKRFSFIEIDPAELSQPTEVVTVPSKIENIFIQEQKAVDLITDVVEQRKEQTRLSAKRFIVEQLSTDKIIQSVSKAAELKSQTVESSVIDNVIRQLEVNNQQSIFVDDQRAELVEIYQQTVSSYIENIIEIPRIIIQPNIVIAKFADFDLDISVGFDFKLIAQEIIVIGLVDNQVDKIGVEFGAYFKQSPHNQLVSSLVNYPEIDYDQNAALINKLVKQALVKLESGLSNKNELSVLIRQYDKYIAGKIYDQMMEHFSVETISYEAPQVRPFCKIQPWNFSLIVDGRKLFTEEVQPKSLIKKYVFNGFKKSCHLEYKFDSDSERIFANNLEHDANVIKWLRPAESQFQIYWNHSNKYEPDFVVETTAGIYLCEVKARDDLANDDVQQKANAAKVYCGYATDYNLANGLKSWHYLLIPHDEINLARSFAWYVANCLV
ncbi:MAG TPA: DEAD/DEAH box helicase family protein [Burkholderiales bacterium]|nr:DEAD/DEAH box helicase family protein [Burkholderiales bacterium]